MMKKIGITGALWLWVMMLTAQVNTLSSLEYWWDDDVSGSIQKTISGSSATLNETVDAATLNDGLHRLNYRIKDSRDAWSQTVTSYFLKRTNVPTASNALSVLQYWWDDDITNAVQKTISSNGIVELSEIGDPSSLNDGLHRLNYRVQDHREAWSQTVTSYFLKRTNVPTASNALSVLQYWWDDDITNAVQKTISSNGIVELSEIGDPSSLNDGLHRLNYRMKDHREAWSQTLTSYFLKRTNVPTASNALSVLQYWWDDDIENATQKTISGSGIVELSETSDVATLNDGLHRLNYRVKDHREAWSQTLTSYFLKRTNLPEIDNVLTTLEYWFNDDYTTHVQKTITQETLISIDEAATAPALSDGIHRFIYRVKDNRGQWSSAVSCAFIKYGENFSEPEIQMNDGKIYQLFDVKLTWMEASDLCERLGGRLAVAETASDSLFIASAIKEHANVNYYWLGNQKNYYVRNTGADYLQCGQLSDSQDYPSSGILGFILEKELSGVGSLEVVFTETADMGIYKNMTLELRKDSTQHFSLTTTEKQKYYFNGVPEGVYQLSLKNKFGNIIGQTNNVLIKKQQQSNAILEHLEAVYVVRLNVTAAEELSEKLSVKWYDADGTLLSVSDSITGVVAGTNLKYQIGLSEALGKTYIVPSRQDYTVIAGNNTVQYTLQEIPQQTIEGRVKAEDMGFVSGATIMVSQLLNGKYSKTTTGKTDKDGNFSLQVYNDSSTIIVSYSGYLNQTITKSNFDDTADLRLITLSPVKGAVVSLNLTYTPSVTSSEIPATESWYSDYQNVDYILYNITQGKAIEEQLVQYPDVIVLDSVGVNDEIRITAHSRVSAFDAVRAVVKLDENLEASAQLNIVQRGSIRVVYTHSENSRNVGILYDANGHWVGQYSYSGNTLQTADLPDGSYQLVSMANSSFFNTMYNLSAFAAAGLVQNTDYILCSLNVEAGKITETTVSIIPVLTESKFYYTGAKTMFSVNKSTVTAGNYLTLRSEIDFKTEHKSKVSNVKLIVDFPEECEFVYNSLMVGNSVSSAYTFADNRLTLSLANYSDVVKFCVVPTQSGNYAPSAFVEFDLDGKTILQPIGTASFKVENMNMTVPSLTAQKTIPVRGVAPANSSISVYDNNVLIGQTKALANGNWSVKCDLHKPYALSFHNIHAEARTSQGLTILSDVRELTHNITAIEVSKVTMYNTAHTAANLDLFEYETVFDFLNPATTSPVYWYWPSYPDFTFTIEFTTSDSTKISNVELYVKTSSNNIVSLPATYDGNKGFWIATRKFDSNNLPVNVSVDYVADTEPLFDRTYMLEIKEELLKSVENYQITNNQIDSIDVLIQNELMNTEPNYVYINELISLFNIQHTNENSDSSLYEYLSQLDTEELIKYIDDGLEFLNSFLNTINDSIQKFEIVLRDYSEYGIYKINLPDGQKAQLAITTCDEIIESNLEKEGYKKIATTNGTYLYMIVSEKGSTIVDFENNKKETIIYEQYIDIASSLRKNSLRSWRNDHPYIAMAIDKLITHNEVLKSLYWAFDAKRAEDVGKLFLEIIQVENQIQVVDNVLNRLTDNPNTSADELRALVNKRRQLSSAQCNLEKNVKKINEQGAAFTSACLSLFTAISETIAEFYNEINDIKRIQSLEVPYEGYLNCPKEAEQIEEEIKSLYNNVSWYYGAKVGRIFTYSLIDAVFAPTIVPAIIFGTAQLKFEDKLSKGYRSVLEDNIETLDNKCFTLKFKKCPDPCEEKGCQFGCTEDGECKPDPCETKGCYFGCTNGECHDEFCEEDCKFGCINGKCNPDPCEGKYCEFGCTNGKCNPDPCEGKDCEFDCTNGRCHDKTCEKDCPFGCTDGECNPDPCSEIYCIYGCENGKCKPPCEDGGCPDGGSDGSGYNGGSGSKSNSGNSGGPDATGQLDPSGYVFEAVTSNRLQGVTASLYQEVEEENMYGELIKKSVLWDAENYEQINPQITDEFGQYSWFVPQGLWQVKYEKEGYETVYSDWLPVPPPQLDVNIAMVQASQPEVKMVQGYESGIKIEFSKFMLPHTLTTDSIFVTRNGVLETGTIALINEEVNPKNSEETFVSRVRLVPEIPFEVSDEVILTVKREVKSYAGIGMAEDFVQRVEIQREIKSLNVPSLLELTLNEQGLLEVSAMPQDVAAGKKIKARSVSSAIATVLGEAVFDNKGKANLNVSGKLPGTTVIYVSIEDTDLREEVLVNVGMPKVIEQVAAPTASLPSGSTVEPNTTVILSTDTEGASIYYTEDGNIPTIVTSLEYTQPIVITRNVTIQAMAVKDGMLNSDIITFEYSVSDDSGVKNVNKSKAVLYVKDKILYIKGLEIGEKYTIYSSIGGIVTQGICSDELEEKVPLPHNGVFIVSTPNMKEKVLF